MGARLERLLKSLFELLDRITPGGITNHDCFNIDPDTCKDNNLLSISSNLVTQGNISKMCNNHGKRKSLTKYIRSSPRMIRTGYSTWQNLRAFSTAYLPHVEPLSCIYSSPTISIVVRLNIHFFLALYSCLWILSTNLHCQNAKHAKSCLTYSTAS
jgi:hypothetical protein